MNTYEEIPTTRRHTYQSKIGIFNFFTIHFGSTQNTSASWRVVNRATRLYSPSSLTSNTPYAL